MAARAKQRGGSGTPRGCASTWPAGSPPQGGRRRGRAGPCCRRAAPDRAASPRRRPPQRAPRCRVAGERTAGRAAPGRGPRAWPRSTSPQSRAWSQARLGRTPSHSWAAAWAGMAGLRPSCFLPRRASPPPATPAPTRPTRRSRVHPQLGGPRPPSPPPPPPAQRHTTATLPRHPKTLGYGVPRLVRGRTSLSSARTRAPSSTRCSAVPSAERERVLGLRSGTIQWHGDKDAQNSACATRAVSWRAKPCCNGCHRTSLCAGSCVPCASFPGATRPQRPRRRACACGTP